MSELVEQIMGTLKDDWGGRHAEWYIEELITALVEPVEQQLAQAQADAATMRGLLEDAVTHMMLTRTTEAQVYLDVRAYLGAHPTQA
jgi:hypothetical protein